MVDDLVVREWTEDEKYYVPVPYWEMYNVVARAHLAVTEERDNWRKAHRETFDRLTRLCADLQQEINDRAAREEKLREALDIASAYVEAGTIGEENMALIDEALAPTDTKEPGR